MGCQGKLNKTALDTNKKNHEYLKVRLPVTKIDQNGQNSTGGTCNRKIDGEFLPHLHFVSTCQLNRFFLFYELAYFIVSIFFSFQNIQNLKLFTFKVILFIWCLHCKTQYFSWNGGTVLLFVFIIIIKYLTIVEKSINFLFK